jgi:hypothetical protein
MRNPGDIEIIYELVKVHQLRRRAEGGIHRHQVDLVGEV